MAVTPRSPPDIAADREDAAAELEGAIQLLGRAHQRYMALTRELGAATGRDFAFSLDVPICMHLSEAGLSSLLERKLHGTPGSLRSLVADAHGKLLHKGNQ